MRSPAGRAPWGSSRDPEDAPMPAKKTPRKSTSVAALIKEKNKAFGAANG